MIRDDARKSVKPLFSHKYYNRKARETVRRMQSPTGVIVEGSILHNMRRQGFTLNVYDDNKSQYDPNELFVQLARYSGRSTAKYNEVILQQAIDLAFISFGNDGVKLPLLATEFDLRAAIKEEKSSGAPEFCRKGETFVRDLDRAKRIAYDERAPDPCVAYHRVQHGPEGPKTRLVWGFPHSMTLLESMFARPLIDHFLSVRSPMAFGLRRHEIAARMTRVENSGIRYSFDFSKFDASIPARLIDTAFSILGTYFDMSEDEKKVWDKVQHYFIHTPILMPDGNVYVKHKGVPSGSYFTQMVDSIVNYILIQYGMLMSTGEAAESGKILVLGDDSLVGHHTHLPLQAMSGVFKAIGFDLSVEKSQVSVYPKPVEFLGHSWISGVVDREPIEIAKRLAFPEKRSGIEDPRLRIVTRMLAFTNDAKCAHNIFVNWSRSLTPNVHHLYYRDRATVPVTGWEEFMGDDYDPGNKSGIKQAYVGILK